MIFDAIIVIVLGCHEPHPSFPGGSDGKAPACNAGNWGSIPGSGRSPGEGTTSILDDKLNWKTLYVFWLPHWQTTGPSPSPSSGFPILRHNTEIRWINNCAMVSKSVNERKSSTSLILSGKLEIIKLSEEGMSKPKRLKARPPASS